MSCGDIFLGVIAIFFPPIAVWIKSGICSADSLINILLCMLGYVPGLLHAWYIIAKYPEPDHDYEPLDAQVEAGGRQPRVTYYYVSHESASPQHGQRQGQQQQRISYGTQNPRVAGKAAGKPVNPAQWQGQQQQQQQSGTVGVGGSSRQTPASASSAGPSTGAGSGEEGAPPSYSDAVRGDNKIQRQN